MSEKFRLDRKIGFQNTFFTKCITIIIDSIGPSIILWSIFNACMDFHTQYGQLKFLEYIKITIIN